MPHLIAIPKLGLTMTDCTLTEWHRADGERVEKGDLLFSIETDKITSEIEADAAGYLRRFAELDSAQVIGSVIGGLYETQAAALAATGLGDAGVSTAMADAPVPVAAVAATPVPAAGGPRIRVSPLARRIARDAGIDTARLTGTGAHGAILRRDVEAAMAARTNAATPPTLSPAPVPLHPAAPAVTMPPAATAPVEGVASRRPLTGLRKSIARNMMASLQGSAQMTAFARVDMAEVVALRAACIADEKGLGVRISVTDIVLKACAMVLARSPAINSSIIGDEVVTWAGVHVGLAVALQDGLIVPVIRDADRKSLVEIAHERIDLAARARAGQLTHQDMAGGTFTLSNFGSYGGEFETPLLNPPQSAILGIGAIAEEVVARQGQIVIRPMMMLSMTFDHRLIDGAVAGAFRNDLRALLERPATMLASLR